MLQGRNAESPSGALKRTEQDITIGSKITWAGDYSNEARTGQVTALNGGMVTVSWANGTQSVLPAFTMTGAKWKVVG